jgi:hypothetical protein
MPRLMASETLMLAPKILQNMVNYYTNHNDTLEVEWSSVARIISRYRLDGPGKILGWCDSFTFVYTGPGVHPASCTMDVLSLPIVQRPIEALISIFHVQIWETSFHIWYCSWHCLARTSLQVNVSHTWWCASYKPTCCGRWLDWRFKGGTVSYVATWQKWTGGVAF